MHYCIDLQGSILSEVHYKEEKDSVIIQRRREWFLIKNSVIGYAILYEMIEYYLELIKEEGATHESE